MNFPVFYTKHTGLPELNVTILAGDIGATKSNLGLFRGVKTLTPERVNTYKTRDFSSVTQMLNAFLQNNSPDVISLGAAGLIENGVAHMTNADIEVDTHRISAAFHGVPVALINDLEATALGLIALQPEDMLTANKGTEKEGNKAIIAPGTGLGESGLYWDEHEHIHKSFATEGGHCDFFPRSRFDTELYIYLKKKYAHVSWERLLSGAGIGSIYLFLKEKKQVTEPEWLTEKMKTEDPAALISMAARNGDSELCVKTMETFFRFLAAESANLVLKLKAVGGLYIGGGIVAKNLSLFNTEKFMKEFCGAGRMSEMLQNVPVRIILNEKTALLGAAEFAVHGKTMHLAV